MVQGLSVVSLNKHMNVFEKDNYAMAANGCEVRCQAKPGFKPWVVIAGWSDVEQPSCGCYTLLNVC